MSQVNNAIQAADKFFTINPAADQIITKGAKAAGRGISQSVLLVAASVQTVFAAAITALFSPLSYIFKDKYASLKGYTASSAEAVVNAAKSIAGALEKNEEPEAIEIKVAEKSNKEKFVEIATSKYAKGAVAAAVVAGLGYAAYAYGPAAYASSSKYIAETVVPFAREQMEFVSNKAQAGYTSAKEVLGSAYEKDPLRKFGSAYEKDPLRKFLLRLF